MKLVSCHIENFGKLHDYSVDFAEGTNIICEENGWGKSTFASFIRAMFYGLEGERKRSIEENEVARYRPWQGGVFGGSLIFEVNGKRYIVTRTFDKTNEFELRDADTNLISNDFSSKLGEEIFKVNRESFMRTVFIGQADCETSSTDDINAKIGTLTDNSDDLSNFDSANKRLTDIINSLTPKRVTGSISKRKNELTELERKVAVGNSIPSAIDSIQEKLQAEHKKYEQLKELIEVVRKEQIYVLEMEKARERVSTYAMTETENTELSNLQTIFEKEVPTEASIKEMLDSAHKLSGLRKTLLTEQLSSQEAAYFEELEQHFADDNVDISEIMAKWNIRNTKQATLSSKEGTLSVLKTAKESQKPEAKSNPLVIIVGSIIAIVGAVVAVALSLIPGIIVAIVGLIVAVAGFFTGKKKVLSEQEFSPEIENLQNEIKADEDFIKITDQEVSGYLRKHGKDFEEYMVISILQQLMNDYTKYTELKVKAEKAKKSTAKADAEHLQKVISDYLQKFGIYSEDDNFTNDLHELNHKVSRYAYLQEKIQNLRKASRDFEDSKKHLNGGVSSLMDINQKLSDLADARETCYQLIDGYNDDLENLREQHDEWEENKIRLEETRRVQDAEQRKYDYVVKAQKYLTEAKESLTARYTAPIFNNFRKYYEIITKCSSDHLCIDANANITVVEQGKQREANTLSSGYRDLIGICLRVALVDVMYTEEKPVLIMDDPFTNLDDKKIEAAKEFLKHVSEEYQIIYFTCSNARS